MSTITLRMAGTSDSIEAIIDSLRGLTDVDRVEELGVRDPARAYVDSSSAGLSDDMPSGIREVEVHAIGLGAEERVRDHTEIAARDTGVVLEWLEPF